MLKFQKWTQILVLYTIIVILWGAWVRISHSGDGCGDTWPLCQGQLIPEAEQGKTWVEYGHRLMSGSFGLLVIGLFFWARKVYPIDHLARRWAGLSLFFTITEALLGAKLVLFKLVGANDTPYRAFIMSLHLINSLMLTASLALAADFAGSAIWKKRSGSPWTFQGLKPQRVVGGLLFAFLLIGVSGAIAALANTLFPSATLVDGFQADWNPDSHFLVRFRGLHPLFGLLFGGSIALTAWLSIQLQKPNETELTKRGRRLSIAASIGIALGLLTLLLLSPLWLKISHLLLAHTIWILMILWLREILYQNTNPRK